MRGRAEQRRGARAGYTLVEMMISVVVLALLLGSVGLVGMSNRRAFEQGAGSADLEVQVRRVVDHVVGELIRTGTNGAVNVLVPDPIQGTGTEDLAYMKAEGIQNGATDWADTWYRLYWDYEVGEIDDGVDNNGNGLIDEGRVLYTRDLGKASEKTIVICHNVAEYLEGETANNLDDNDNGLKDERGFCIERVDDALLVRLTLETRVADSGLQARTIETSVRPRN